MLKAIATTMLVLGMTLAAGCAAGEGKSKMLDTLGAARMAPGHEPVVIDGQDTSGHKWDKAATLKFPDRGVAQLLWDSKGVYGCVHDAGRWAPTAYGLSTLCVRLGSFDGKMVRHIDLHMVADWPDQSPDLGEMKVALVRVAALQNFAEVPVDRQRVQFANVRTGPPAQGVAWGAEFFVPWDLLGGDGAPPRQLWVRVVRVLAEPPTDTLFMGTHAGETPRRESGN